MFPALRHEVSAAAVAWFRCMLPGTIRKQRRRNFSGTGFVPAELLPASASTLSPAAERGPPSTQQRQPAACFFPPLFLRTCPRLPYAWVTSAELRQWICFYLVYGS